MKVSILTGGKDPPYALGLLSGLITKNIEIDFIGNSEMEKSKQVMNNNVVYYNLRGDQTENASFKEKVFRVIKYYYKLIVYASKTDSNIFHILWFNKFELVDRVFLNIYYKLLGKKVLLTAHNVNEHVRDERSNFYNKFTLKFMYKLVDHIFVHTDKMKKELMVNYNVKGNNITVVPFGVNNITPSTNISKDVAREKLNLDNSEKVLLFFGNIAPYKGLENLLLSLVELKYYYDNIKIIIAGRIKDCHSYWEKIQTIIKEYDLDKYIITNPYFIPDEEVEYYFKAADVLIIPYKYIFQSGVLFLSYNFGLPVIVTDVGSLKEDVIEGKTGFVCRPEDPKDLGDTIIKYYQSDLYNNLEYKKDFIINYAYNKHSWDKVADITLKAYDSINIH